jgi:prophage tail gpP-like protein
MRLDSGDRTYFVSDERLREFAKLTLAERLAWVVEPYPNLPRDDHADWA